MPASRLPGAVERPNPPIAPRGRTPAVGRAGSKGGGCEERLTPGNGSSSVVSEARAAIEGPQPRRCVTRVPSRTKPEEPEGPTGLRYSHAAGLDARQPALRPTVAGIVPVSPFIASPGLGSALNVCVAG